MSTDFSTGFSLGLAILCVLTLIFCLYVMYALRKMYGWIRDASDALSRSAPATRIAHLSAELTDLRDAYDALLAGHTKLRKRITMRENRQKKAEGGESMADSERDTLKGQLREKARKQGHTKI